jgi:hypothetical protein
VGTFAAFFALDGDYLGFAGDARFFFTDVFFTAAFLGDFAFTLATRRFSFGPAEAPPRPRIGAAAAAGFSVLAAASLKDPDVPLPFVCTNAPEATAVFRYILMKGDSFQNQLCSSNETNQRSEGVDLREAEVDYPSSV